MNSFLNKILLIALASMVLWSCEKDETQAVVKSGSGLTLSVSQPALVLDAAQSADTVETFSWTPADFGYDAGVTYTLQLAKVGTNFATPVEVNVTSDRGKAYTTEGINQLALGALGLSVGSAGQIEARVKATVSPKVAPAYSNIVPLAVTPYIVIINYPSLWVPGAYQGWAPGVAGKISSVSDNGMYEGYISFSGSNLEFKLTSSQDWDHTNYGWASSTVNGNDVTGTLSTAGNAGNLFVPMVGYYRVKANTTALTWEAVRTDWGLIGDAVPVTGWDSDQNLNFDPTTNTWSITLDLIGGKSIKFRANDGWTINLGDNDADSSLEYDGANIAIAADGNYTVTLDLSLPGYYKYKVVKN